MSILDNEGHDPNGLGNRPDHESIASYFERELMEAEAEIDRLRDDVAMWKDRYESLLRDAQAMEQAYNKRGDH